MFYDVEKSRRKILGKEEIKSENQRPPLITVLTILGFTGILSTFLSIVNSTIKTTIEWYPQYLMFSVIVGLFSFFGFWFMRKWSVYLYSGFSILNQIVSVLFFIWNPISIILPGIYVLVGFRYLKKMK